jgi:trigger factor
MATETFGTCGSAAPPPSLTGQLEADLFSLAGRGTASLYSASLWAVGFCSLLALDDTIVNQGVHSVTEVVELKKSEGGDGSTLAAALEKKAERIAFEVLEEEKQPGSRVRFKVKVAEQSFAPRLADVLKEFGKQVRVPGFRPGKAPQTLVKRQFEPAAREETVKRISGGITQQFVEDKKYEPVSQVLLLDFKSNLSEGTTIELALEVEPEVILNEEVLAGLTAESHRVAIDDAYVDEQILAKRAAAAIYEPTDEAYQAKDGLLFSCTVTTPQGSAIEDRSVKNYYSTNIETEMPEAVAAALVGKKKGDTLSLDVAEQAEDAAPGVLESVHYDVEIHEVKKRVLPVLDDAFASENGGHASVAELREATLREAASTEESRLREETLNQLLTQLRDRLDFDLPRALVQQRQESSIMEMERRLNTMGMSLRQMDQMIIRNYSNAMRETARVQVKNGLIVAALTKYLSITASEADVDAELDKAAARTGRKKLAIRAQLEAKKQWDDFQSSIALKLTNDALIARASVTYKDCSFKEYQQLVKKAQDDQAAKLRTS